MSLVSDSWLQKERRSGTDRRSGTERRAGADARPPPPSPLAAAAPKTWGDLASMMIIMSALIGGIAWGLKLESKIESVDVKSEARTNSMYANISELKATVGHGILPITEERIRYIEAQILEIRDDKNESKAMQIRMEGKLDGVMSILTRRIKYQ
jgi:hypothetical protein